MPWYIAEYLGDTRHLNAAQHGAYLLLIGAYWVRGGPLPDDDAQLGRMAAMTPREWRRNRQVVEAFFHIEGGLWNHKRVDKELRIALVNRDQKGRAGKASALKRQQTRSTAVDNPLQRLGNPSPSPSPIENLNQKPDSEPAREAGASPPTAGTGGYIGGGPLDTSDQGPMAALAAENRRRHKAGLPPMNAAEVAAWKKAQRTAKG